MTTIKALCPCCGDAELTPADVTLMVCTQARLSYYSFTCPTCGDTVRKPADEQVVALLVRGGVTATRWSVPAEVLEVKPGPPLGYDDLLELGLALARTDLLAALAGSVTLAR